jgi:predicted nuclease of predicted toxin-antitoxin system
MRFLVDESVSGAVTQYLRGYGHDVLAVAEVTPRALDSDILRRATVEDRIVITNDKDFGELIFRGSQAHHGVLLFRLNDESAVNQVQVLAGLLSQYADRLSGQFAVVSERRVRFRGRRQPPSDDAG